MAFLRTLFSCLAVVFLLFSFTEAREILVGGKENSWKIPSFPDDFNKWAEKTRFEIGDFVVLKYDPKSDSVLQVSEEDYKSCNKAKPIKEYQDGDTKVELDKSGPFYFISGAQGHCEKGQKLEVMVLSAKHGQKGHSPAPSPAGFPVPAAAPANDGYGLSVGLLGVAMVVGSLAGLVLV